MKTAGGVVFPIWGPNPLAPAQCRGFSLPGEKFREDGFARKNRGPWMSAEKKNSPKARGLGALCYGYAFIRIGFPVTAPVSPFS